MTDASQELLGREARGQIAFRLSAVVVMLLLIFLVQAWPIVSGLSTTTE